MERFRDKLFDCVFCCTCGQYLYSETNKNIKSIICNCDKKYEIFKNYKSFIGEISYITDGDILDDYIENPKDGHPDFMKYIYNMILFGITYDTPQYYKIDGYITDNIINFTI